MPDLLQLTEDPRYTRLSWEEKQGVLDRFAEDNPTDALPTIKEFERLNHFSQNGTPQTRAYHRDVLTARRKWLSSQRSGGVNKSTADAIFEEDAKVAHAAYRDALDRRQKDLSLAAELLDAEETTSLSFGNVVGDVVDSINPASIIARASGGDSNRDEVFTQAQNRTEEILREFTDLGYTEEDIETIKQDAQLANGAGGNPAAVDSQGQVVVNDGALVLNPQSVRDTISGLDASSNVKQAALDSLESRRRQLIDGTFDAIAFEGGLTWDEEPGSFDRTNPRLSPLVGFKTIIPNFFSETARRLGVDGTDAEQRLRGSVEARDAGGIFGYRWTDEQKEEAVVNLLNERDDALDRARIGLGQGVLTDTANMILTPLELAGSDTAAGLSEQIREGEEAFSSADRLVNVSGTEEFIGLASRVIPQVVLTRGAGRAGGSLAAARGAAPAAQAQLAQRFAVGFGGLQSATFNTRDVLDNGGSPGEALAAGILAFGTTYLLASGFNAAGAGGVEQFRSKAAAGSATAKSQLTQRLVNLGTGAVGEGVEEFVDEYINTLATQSFTGVSAEEAASNALKGGLIGSVLGGGFGAAQPTRPVTPQSSNEELRQAADQAAAELSAGTVRTQEIDTRIAALENREELTPEEDAELQRLLAERERGTPFEEAPEAAEETTPEVDRETPESPFTEADHLEQEVAVDERSVAEPATQPARATQPRQDASPTVPEEAGTRPKMVPGQRATIEGHTGTLVDDGGRLALDLGGGRLLELTDAQLAAATLRPTPFQQNEDGTVTLDGRGRFRYNRSEFDENGDLASVVVSRPSGEEVVLTGDRALSVAFRARLDAAPERARTAPPQPAQETFTAERVFGPATYRGLDSAVSVAERVAEAEAPLGSVDAVPTSEVITARNQMAARIAEVEQRASRGGYANATETLDKLRVVHDVLAEEVASRKSQLRQNLYDRLFAGREDVSSQEVEETLEEVMDSGRTDLTEDEENTIVEEYAEAAVENGTVEENPTGMISKPDLNTAAKIKLQRELDNTREVNEQLMEEAREGNHYGKTGIPKKYLTEEPTLQTVEEFGDWIADRHEARDNYIEKPNVNPNEESVREEQIQISEELLTAYEEYLEDTAPETDGTTPPTLYGGLFFLDPEFMIPRLKAIASASADFLSFSKQAILRFGSAIVDGLRSIWNSYQRNGEIEPDTVEQLPQGATVETTEHDAAADASFEEVKAAAGPAGTSPLTTIDGVEAPESVIPLISREDAKTLGGLKQSAVNLLDRVVLLGNKITGLRVPPNLLQNAKDFRPNIAIAANAFSLSTLRSEANLTRTLLEKKFPDLEVTVEDSGNIVVHGALRNDGQPTPKYFSDLAEDIQRNFDKYDFASDNVREFFKEVVRFNQYTLKMLESEGIVPADLKADGVNQLDLSKLADNIHATRGRVTHRDLLDNPDTNAVHRARLASTGTRGQRRFETEREGVEAGYIYPDHPFDRLVNQIISAKVSVYNQRLFSDSDFRSVARPRSRTTVTRETVDPVTGDPVLETRSVKKGNELREEIVSLGMLEMRATTADAATIQHAIDRIHKNTPFLAKLADAASFTSKVQLTLDASPAVNQLLYSLITNPKNWARSISISSQNFVNQRQALRDEVEARSDVIKLAIQHGGQWATVAEEFITSSEQRDVLAPRREGLAGRLQRPAGAVNRFLNRFGEFQGLSQSLAASYVFEAELQKLKAEGRYTPRNIGIAARAADNIHGRENLDRYGLNHQAVLIARTLFTASGMYMGYTGAAIDMFSPDPALRKVALKRLGLFALAIHTSYFALAMAAEMLGEDEDDESTLKEKAKKIGARMIPGARDYLTMDINVGNGTKKIAWGGFYRGLMNAVLGTVSQDMVDTLGFEANNDTSFMDRISRFSFGKFRNSTHIIEQLLTGEDFFNRPSTGVEIIRQNIVPLSFQSAVERASDPVLTHLHQMTGMDLVTLERIAETKPDFRLSAFDFITSFLGFSGYIEDDAKQYRRALNSESKRQFGKGYDGLTMDEARSVRTKLNQDGITKPAFKGDIKAIMDLNRKSFRNDFGGRRFNNLDRKTIDSLASRIPYNVTLASGEERTLVPSQLREVIKDQIIEGYQQAYDEGFRGEALRTKAKDVANRVRRANGLPAVY